MENQQPFSEAVDLELEPNDDIPEEDEDLSLSDTANTTLAPPERIAARFYRPSVTRRKSSATSSRRNSLTSNHSQMSNSSYRQACRNNHVAQYLRRASILEGRKQRLQAREAHAEQVRLRAALAKCAPRSSNSEERALAAQRAREEHLAKVAGACAEEVRRAKEKAEQMKKQRAAEEERYRQEIEDKQAEVQRRRLEYKKNALRRPRGASTPPNAEVKKPTVADLPQLEPEAAAERIQIAWRTRRRKKILTSFTNLGLSVDMVHDATFEVVQAKLMDEKVLSATTKILEMYNLLANDPTPSDKAPGAQTRNFLTAFMILGHPTAIFSNDGELERGVITKAKDLILCFEQVITKSTAFNRFTPTPTLMEDLLLAHSAFLQVFEDWKAQDKSTLIEMMVASFANLDAIWQSVKDDTDGEVATDYRDGIRTNQIMLLSKLQKLAGKPRTNTLIRKAITDSRRKNPRRKPIGDVRPRVAVEQVIHPEVATGSRSVTPTPETASHLSPSTSARSDTQSISISKLFSIMPDNRTLTHELALDKDYRMGNADAAALKSKLNTAVCREMLEGFKSGNGTKWTVSMVESIRGNLLHVVKPGNATHSLISEVLDPALTEQQCAAGTFSYEKFFSFMAKLLPRLCAPFRDAEVQALVQELRQDGSLEDMIAKLGRLLRTIDDLSLDHSNFMLTLAKPALIGNAAEYERCRFEEDIRDGKITLQRTKRWWHNANVNCLTERDQQDPRGNLTVRKIYARGLVDLAIASTPLKESEVPETLQLDAERLSKIRGDAVRITTIAAILLTAKNLLKRDVRQQWPPEAARIWEILRSGYGQEDETIPAKVHSVIESARGIPPHVKPQLQGTISRLLAQAETGKLRDAVAKVLFQRLKTHIFNRISASSDGERVRIASSTSQDLATSGFPEFMEQVGGIVELLGRISDVDRKAHGLWYEQVAAECENMGDGEESEASAAESTTPPSSEA